MSDDLNIIDLEMSLVALEVDYSNLIDKELLAASSRIYGKDAGATGQELYGFITHTDRVFRTVQTYTEHIIRELASLKVDQINRNFITIWLPDKSKKTLYHFVAYIAFLIKVVAESYTIARNCLKNLEDLDQDWNQVAAIKDMNTKTLHDRVEDFPWLTRQLGLNAELKDIYAQQKLLKAILKPHQPIIESFSNVSFHLDEIKEDLLQAKEELTTSDLGDDTITHIEGMRAVIEAFENSTLRIKEAHQEQAARTKRLLQDSAKRQQQLVR